MPHTLARHANAHPGNLLQGAPLHVRTEQRIGQAVTLLDDKDFLGIEKFLEPGAGMGQLGVPGLQATGPIEKPVDIFERRGAEVRQVEKLLVTPPAKLADGLDACLFETMHDTRAQARFGNGPVVDLLARKLSWLNSFHKKTRKISPVFHPLNNMSISSAFPTRRIYRWYKTKHP